MAKKILFVPFSKSGDLLPWVEREMDEKQKEECVQKGSFCFLEKDIAPGFVTRCPQYANDVRICYKPNYVFEDTLVFVGYVRGCSAARIQFTAESNGAKYEMFLSDFEDAMMHSRIEYTDEKQTGIRISGNFTFVKKGQNFGVRKVV